MKYAISPLAVLNKQSVKFMPRHFSTVEINQHWDLEPWIKGHIKGRYSIQSSTTVSVGFEEPADLTYFLLACPYIRRTNER